jgi:tRNA U34 5-methylaminomethyl-2-thiouridine-forming methyltransferase MnmC
MYNLTGALTPEPTADGSFTLFSEDFGEWFHSRQGAYAEAFQTYVEATDLATLAQRSTLTILDVCYGLGYNTAAALTTIQRVNPRCRVALVGLELDHRVPQQAIREDLNQGWPEAVQTQLAILADQGTIETSLLQADLLLGDARQQIQQLVATNFQADVIFFDPFSPPHCPELWTVEFIKQVARCLKPDGKLATYSCAAAVRTALGLAGLHIGSIKASGRRWPGTLAQPHPNNLSPLSEQERDHLTTKAAVPYRDPALNDRAEVIFDRRKIEQQSSILKPTSLWRKRWLTPHLK